MLEILRKQGERRLANVRARLVAFWAENPAKPLLDGHVERAELTDAERPFQGLRVKHQFEGVVRATAESKPGDLDYWLRAVLEAVTSLFHGELKKTVNTDGLASLSGECADYAHTAFHEKGLAAEAKLNHTLYLWKTLRLQEWNSMQSAHARIEQACIAVHDRLNPGWKKSLGGMAAGLAVFGVLHSFGLGFLAGPAFTVPVGSTLRDETIKSSGVFEADARYRALCEQFIAACLADAMQEPLAELAGLYRLRTQTVRELAQEGWDVAQALAESVYTLEASCPVCTQAARVPADCGRLKVTCQNCARHYEAMT